MFCKNCGNKINDNEKICNHCHKKLTKTNKKSKDKLIFTIFLTVSALLLVGLITSMFFLKTPRLSWAINNTDYKIKSTKPTTLKLSVIAYDKNYNQISDIKFSASAGKLDVDKATVYWTLPNKEGKYTIYAMASGKKIKKTVTVVSKNNLDDKANLASIVIDKYDPLKDEDNDGIINKDEEKYKTDPYSADTDKDGLTDYYEINVSKTDPLKKDTDNDGISDGDEIELKLDPLKADSLGDNIKDGDRVLAYQMTDDNVNLTIKGKGNIASTVIDIFSNDSITNMEGTLNKIYSFYTEGKLEKATVRIKYDEDEILEKGLTLDDLSLYYFNDSLNKLEKVETTIDKENGELVAELSHFSKYIIGDSKKIFIDNKTKLLFVIDNSFSMYSEEQLEKLNISTYTDGNDAEFKRISLTNKMIDKFTGEKYLYGVSEFSGDYAKLYGFDVDKEKAKSSANSMKNNWHTTLSGTNIVDALSLGIKEFNEKSDENYLILLTDGANNIGSLKETKDDIINNALEKNVKICVIGLGNNVDDYYLNEIAEMTRCDYYSASSDDALSEIYAKVASDIHYGYVDTDEDGKFDGIIRYDTGFLINRDGFSFENYGTKDSPNGHCYGMALFAKLNYLDRLPLSLGEKEIRKKHSQGYNLNGTYFDSNKNLYDFKFTTPALKLIMDSGLPDDYRDRIENNTYMINKDYIELLDTIGIQYRNVKIKDKEFKYYQSAQLNIESDKFLSNTKDEEHELLKAIWRLFILQFDGKSYSFIAEPDVSFNYLMNKMEDKEPIILAMFGKKGNTGHAVNAIKLIQDIEDANLFKLEVYDNNEPGVVKYITLRRNKMKFALNYTTWTNKYDYTASYNDEDINLSLLEESIS